MGERDIENNILVLVLVLVLQYGMQMLYGLTVSKLWTRQQHWKWHSNFTNVTQCMFDAVLFLALDRFRKKFSQWIKFLHSLNEKSVVLLTLPLPLPLNRNKFHFITQTENERFWIRMESIKKRFFFFWFSFSSVAFAYIWKKIKTGKKKKQGGQKRHPYKKSKNVRKSRINGKAFDWHFFILNFNKNQNRIF